MSQTDKTMELLPCPFCGHAVPDDLTDTLYPSGIYWRPLKGYRQYVSHRDRKPDDRQCWQIVCNTIYGGCSAEMHADSKEEVVSKWNTRAHIEAMQRDCRTCKHIRFSTYEFEMVCRHNALAEEKCTNHDKYRPAEFKQLTRSE